jgi:mannitol-1-phosphate/altronate dehydrogenase
MADEEFSVEGPGGLKAAAKGAQTLPVLLTFAIAAWIWYVSTNVEARADEKTKAQLVATEKLAAAVEKQTKALEQQEKTGRAIIYVLTMPQKDREKLNLIRPDVLFEMQGYPRER